MLLQSAHNGAGGVTASATSAGGGWTGSAVGPISTALCEVASKVPAVREEIFWLLRKGASTVTAALRHAVSAGDAVSATVAAWGLIGLCGAISGPGARLAPTLAIELLGSALIADATVLVGCGALCGELLAVELRCAVVSIFVTAARYSSSCAVGAGALKTAASADVRSAADHVTDHGDVRAKVADSAEAEMEAEDGTADSDSGAADEIASAVNSIADAWSIFLDPLTGTDPWTGTELGQQASPPRPHGRNGCETRRDAARFFASTCLSHASTVMVPAVAGAPARQLAFNAALTAAVASTRCKVAEYMALSSITSSEAASASIMIKAELENTSADPAALAQVLEAAGLLGARHAPCRPPVLQFLASFLTTPAIALQIGPDGGQASTAVVKKLTTVCAESLVQVSLSSGNAEEQKSVAIKVLGSLTTAVVLSRHEGSSAMALARSNVIEALGMIAECLFEHGLDLVGTSAALLGQQLFNPPSPLDAQIVLKLGNLGIISSATTFKAICEQLLQIVSHLLEHLAAQRAPAEPRVRTRTLTTEQGGGGSTRLRPVEPRVGSYPAERSGLTSINVPELLQVLPTAISVLATRHRDSTRRNVGGGSSNHDPTRPHQQCRWLRDQLVALFVNFGTRALDHNALKAQQWSAAIADLAPTLRFLRVALSDRGGASAGCTPDTLNGAVQTLAQAQAVATNLASTLAADQQSILGLIMFWSLLTALNVNTETSRAASAGFVSLASETPSLANIQPEQLFDVALSAGAAGPLLPGIGGGISSSGSNDDAGGFVLIGPAVHEKLGVRAYEMLNTVLGSSATPHLKALDFSTIIYFAAVLNLESQRCIGNGAEFACMIQYLSQWGKSGPAIVVLSMMADVVFGRFVAHALQSTGTVGQEDMLQTVAISLFAYFNDVAAPVKEASDRYLVGLLNAFPFLFWSQRVLVAILDLLNRLSANMPSHRAPRPNTNHSTQNAELTGVQLPAVLEDYVIMVATYTLKCEEYIQQSTSFAGRTTYSILQAYTASIDFNFTGTGHAGVELAMKILLTNNTGSPASSTAAGGNENGARQQTAHPFAQFGTGVALQSRLAAEMSVLVGEHTSESLAKVGDKLATDVMNVNANVRPYMATVSRARRSENDGSERGRNGNENENERRLSYDAASGQRIIQPLLRLVALTIANDHPPSAWIRAIVSAPIVATSSEAMVAGTFAWRWLLSKRPLLAADLVAEISAAIARMFAAQRQLLHKNIATAATTAKTSSWGKFGPAVKKSTVAAEWPALELFAFLESQFASGNKARRDQSFVYCKIAWDTLNAIAATGVGLDLHVRYAGLAYVLVILQSGMPRPLTFDERSRRRQLYDTALMTFAARLRSPRLHTLWRDVAAMVRFWKLLVGDKYGSEFLKLEDTDGVLQYPHQCPLKSVASYLHSC